MTILDHRTEEITSEETVPATQPEPVHQLRVLDINRGLTVYEWTASDQAAMDRAANAFNVQRRRGSMASTDTIDPETKTQGDVITTFDPEAMVITVTPQVQGG